MYKNLSYLKTNLKTELSHFCQPNPNSFFIKFICLRVFFLVQGCMVEKKKHNIWGLYDWNVEARLHYRKTCSDQPKTVVQTGKFCKEILEFSQGHRRL